MSEYSIFRHGPLCLMLAIAGCSYTVAPTQAPSVPFVAGLVQTAHGPAAYPPDMERQGIEGWAVADCAIDASGIVHDCKIAETSNHGFDAATLLIAAGLRFRATRVGVLPLAHVRYRMSFNLSGSTPQPRHPTPRWAVTSEGCRVWNQVPIVGETISWSGACVDGFAEGKGRAAWRQPHQAQDTFAVADPTATDLAMSSTYTGTMHHGLPQGDGVVEAFDLDTGASRFVVRGTFRDGRLEGHGAMTAATGVSYDGEYHLDRKEGHGVTTYPTGTRYVGEFRDGSWEGQGRITWGHGSFYEGGFHHGLIDGDGAIVVRSADRENAGDLVLKGTWQQGCFLNFDREYCVKLPLWPVGSR